MPGRNDFKYKPDDLIPAINQCMEYCTSQRKPPVDFVLHQFTPISSDAMQDYLKFAAEMEKGSREWDEGVIKCADAIKKWQEFKTYFWAALGMDNEKLQPFAIFNLKQPCNGGYSDKPPAAMGNTEVVVRLEGVGGDKAFG